MLKAYVTTASHSDLLTVRGFTSHLVPLALRTLFSLISCVQKKAAVSLFSMPGLLQ